jgi:hypothetical protein
MPTLTIAGTITFPLGAEATPPPGRPFSAQLIYSQRNIDDITLVGAQVDVNLMGQIANAKACYIEVDQGSGTLKINGVASALPISVTGGFWIWFNPSGGLTALSVTTAANAKFRVYLFT